MAGMSLVAHPRTDDTSRILVVRGGTYISGTEPQARPILLLIIALA